LQVKYLHSFSSRIFKVSGPSCFWNLETTTLPSGHAAIRVFALQTFTQFDARFEVLMALKIQVEVFSVVMPCSFVIGYQRQSLHPEGRSRKDLRNVTNLPKNQHGVTSQKTSSWIPCNFPRPKVNLYTRPCKSAFQITLFVHFTCFHVYF
jgi:hypothetical protein